MYKKNFITYFIGEHDDDKDKSEKVRVNGKYSPSDTKIGVPGAMWNYRKTTLVQKSEGSQWTVLEDRVPAREFTSDIGGLYARCLIFLQEPRYWTEEDTGVVTDVAFNAIDPTVLEGFSV